MTFAKIITAALITVTAATSFAETKCDHKAGNGLMANTNPPVVKTVQTGTQTTQGATR